MTWRKWKAGLLIAFLCGLLSAGAGLTGRMDWQSFVAVLCASLLTHFLTFIKNHPIEDVQDGENTMTKKVMSLFAIAALCAVFVGCASNSRTVTNKDGSSSKTRNGTLLENVTGYSDKMQNPDGSMYETTVSNITGDVQMVQALDGLLTHVTQAILMAAGNTNLLSGTNASLLALPPPRAPVPQRR